MHDRLRRHRKAVALLATLVMAATISVVAPATATARQVRHSTSTVVTAEPAKGPVGTRQANDWSW